MASRSLSMALAVALLCGCAPSRHRDGAAPIGGGTPAISGDVAVATTLFLDGGQRLLRAAGDDEGQARAGRALTVVLERRVVVDSDLTAAAQVARDAERVVSDRDLLERTDLAEVTHAAARIGAATFLQRRAIDRAERASAGTLQRLTNLGHARDRALLASRAPANLRSMQAITRTLFAFLRARGVDPMPEVERTLSDVASGAQPV